MKEYIIEIEMADAGHLFTEDNVNDFVIRHLVNIEEMKTRERVSGLMCSAHFNFPEVAWGISRGLIVIKVKTCCKEFSDIIDKRFSGVK